jgi:two-component system sensor histidine kinase SenX3
MSPADVAVTGSIALLVAIAGFLLGRRSLHTRVRELEDAGRRAERELEERTHASREARRVQDRILGSMQEGVLLFDEAGGTVFSNDALAVHLGDRPDAIRDVFPAGIQETIRRVAGSGSTEIAEFEMGEPSRWLRVTATPVTHDGSVLVVVGDVTEARTLDALRRDFVANASHELKTPAASIQAAAETLLHVWRDDPGAVPRFAMQLEREAMRLSRIVADLLDLSRLEAGSDLDEQVRLDALLREEGQRCEESVRDAGLTLDIDAPPVPVVHGSARDLSLLVRNLLDNAIRYAKAGGSIQAAVEARDGGVILRICDTGVGIPTKDVPRVFERFYRVDRARSRETGGTGLGLAIVRHVAENHGGTVTVQSELGRGSTFEVRLPAQAAAHP